MQAKALIDRITLLNITLFVEAFVLLTATFWSQAVDIELLPALRTHTSKILLGLAAGGAMAAVSLALYFLARWVKPLSGLREIIVRQIAPIFADINFFDAVVIASVSGFCEEVLFRGVIQPQLALVPTSIIFGLFHCPSLKHLSYGVWAFAAGLFLGWLYQTTGSLWPPIVAHAVSNCISLLFLRYCVKPEPELEDSQDNSDADA